MLHKLPIHLTQSEKEVLVKVLRSDPNKAKLTVRKYLTLILISMSTFIVLVILAWLAINMDFDDEIIIIFRTIANAIDGKDIFIFVLLLSYLYIQGVAERRAALLRKFYAYLSNSSPDETDT